MTTKKNRNYRNTKKKNSNQKGDIVTNLKQFIMSRKLKKAKAKTLSNNRLNLSGGGKKQPSGVVKEVVEKKTLEQIEGEIKNLDTKLVEYRESYKANTDNMAVISAKIKEKESDIKTAKEQEKTNKTLALSKIDNEKKELEAFIKEKKRKKQVRSVIRL